jgi:hypothetical protein
MYSKPNTNGYKAWWVISPAGKVYKSFKSAWASPEGKLLAANLKKGKGGKRGKQVAAAEEEEEAEEKEEKKNKEEDDDKDEEDWEAPRKKRKNDDDEYDDDDDDADEEQEVARKQAPPPPPPRKKAKKNNKPAPQSSVSVKDWIASLSSDLKLFADLFKYIEWSALFDHSAVQLQLKGIPDDAVLPLLDLIQKERRRVEGGK